MTSSSDSWTPFDCLPTAQLTPSGLLELDVNDGEVELMKRNDMELRCEMTEPMVPLTASGYSVQSTSGKKWIDRDHGLKVSITTHRIVFFKTISRQQEAVHFLHLSNIHQVVAAGGKKPGASGFFSNPSYKILINSYLGDLLLVFRPADGSTINNSVCNKDRDDMLKFIQKALERRAWEVARRIEDKQKTALSSTLPSRKVGVDSILSKNALKHKEAARLTDEAFSGDDSEALLKEATELLTIIRKYVVTLEKNEASNADLSQDEDAKKLIEMLQNMGMTSALSKQDYRGGGSGGKDDSVHDEYYTTLARHIADFLYPKLPSVGGIMTLTDVYCLFNRARGTNLISPEDLLKATECMEELNVGIVLRTFQSGLKVIQLNNETYNDIIIAEKLKHLAIQKGNVTSIEASRELHISALLANEQLLASESLGYLCRDGTLETIRFYPNKFHDFTW